MSGSVATRIDSPDFWKGLDRLRAEWKMTTPQLVKFMCNSVATRIGLLESDFWVGLQTLRTCRLFDTGTICGFMCNGIASRLSAQYASCLVDMATHLQAMCNIDMERTLKQLFYNSPYA